MPKQQNTDTAAVGASALRSAAKLMNAFSGNAPAARQTPREDDATAPVSATEAAAEGELRRAPRSASDAALINLFRDTRRTASRRTEILRFGNDVWRALKMRASGDVTLTVQGVRLTVAFLWAAVAAHLFFIRTNTMVRGETTTASGMPIDHAANLYDIYLILTVAGGMIAVITFLIGHLNGRYTEQEITDRSRILGRRIAIDLNAFDRRFHEHQQKLLSTRGKDDSGVSAYDTYSTARELCVFANDFDFFTEPYGDNAQTPHDQRLSRYEAFLRRPLTSTLRDDHNEQRNAVLAQSVTSLAIGALLGIVLAARMLNQSIGAIIDGLSVTQLSTIVVYQNHFSLIFGGLVIFVFAHLVARLIAPAIFRRQRLRRLRASFDVVSNVLRRENAPTVGDLAERAGSLTAMIENRHARAESE